MAHGRGLGNREGLDCGSPVPTLVPSAPEGIIFLRRHTSDYDPVVKEAHGKWIVLRTLTASERISFPRVNLDVAIWKADVFIVKGGDWLPWVYNCASKALFSLWVQGCVIAADVRGCWLHWALEPQCSGFPSPKGLTFPQLNFQALMQNRFICFDRRLQDKQKGADLYSHLAFLLTGKEMKGCLKKKGLRHREASPEEFYCQRTEQENIPRTPGETNIDWLTHSHVIFCQ